MKLLFVKFPFGTEMRMSQQNHEGGWLGIGMVTVGIHPNDFDLYPNKIPPGRVVQNCLEVNLILPNQSFDLSSFQFREESLGGGGLSVITDLSILSLFLHIPQCLPDESENRNKIIGMTTM